MKTTFTATYRQSDPGFPIATIKSPHMILEGIFIPGNYVQLYEHSDFLEIDAAYDSVPGQYRIVALKTLDPNVLMRLEEQGWVFTKGREIVVKNATKERATEEKV